MRRFAVLAISVLPIFAAEIRIDHVTVAGAHLEAMRQAFTAAAGVPTEYGGRHANHATEMALTSFPDGSYVELMAVQPNANRDAVRAQPWSKFLESDAGPCAFAVRAPDVPTEAARLRSAGIPVRAPERSGRTRPDGARLEWEIADVGPAPRGSLFPFLIRDFTPRNNRAYLSGKPTTERFRGIGKVVIGVHDLDSAIAEYRRAFGLPAPRLQRDATFGAVLAWFEGTPIVLAKGLAEDSWLSRRVREYGDAPCAFVLTATGGQTGARASEWFGSPIFWTSESTLGWRLGMEVPR
jgi:Glyoxalase-like domain